MLYIYRVYGLNLSSPIPLSGLQNGEKYCGQNIDIMLTIVFDYEAIIPQVDKPKIEFSDEEVVIIYQEGWKMSISKKGNEITIYSQEKYVEIACTLLLGTGLNILLLYRGFMPLHAGGFCLNNKCIAIAGKSGVGKSTFMQNILRNGYKIFSDDCLPLIKVNEEIKCVPSDNMKSKLRESVITHFAISEQNVEKKGLYNGKLWVSIDEKKRVKSLARLRSVYLLEPCQNDGVFCEEIPREQKNKVFFDSILCLNDLPWRDIKNRISIGRELAQDLRFTRLHYPRTFDGLDLALNMLIDNEKLYDS